MPDRAKQITRASLIGILANVLLAAGKATVGLLAGSVAVVLDAINNLSDALSSVITVIGVRLARRAPDKKHPFGHGRVEYISAIIIAAILLTTGVLSLIESFKKIRGAEPANYSIYTLAVIIAAIIVKLLLGRYAKKQGKKYNSDALIASGEDASFDAILTASTLLGALITLIWHISIDGILGVIISGFIIRSGVELLMRPLHRILGVREDSETTRGIKALIRDSFPEVEGVYDLILHNYGPSYAIGSVHIEIPDTMTAKDIHVLSEEIQHAVFSAYSVFLTVGIYAVDTTNSELAEMSRVIRDAAETQESVLGVHGIFINKKEKRLSFDIVVDFTEKDRAALVDVITRRIVDTYPGYNVHINLDSDFTD